MKRLITFALVVMAVSIRLTAQTSTHLLQFCNKDPLYASDHTGDYWTKVLRDDYGVLKSGTVEYDGGNTFTFTNAQIDCSEVFFIQTRRDVVLRFVGKNKFLHFYPESAALVFGSNVVLEAGASGATLEVEPWAEFSDCIWLGLATDTEGYKLTIRNGLGVTLNGASTKGDRQHYCINASNTSTVAIDNSSLLMISANRYPFHNHPQLQLNGTYLAEPIDGRYDAASGYFLAANGELSRDARIIPISYGAVQTVTLNESLLQFNKINETAQLSATFVPAYAYDRSLTWSSSNNSVAQVSTKGVVTAIGQGTCTITATSSNGKKGTCEVTVSDQIYPTSIVINNMPSLLFTNTGSSYSRQLYVTLTPDNATVTDLTWSSSNTSVATVSNGTVTPVGLGSCTITVKTKNGKTADIKVAVDKNGVLPTGISLNETTAMVQIGRTLQLSAAITPSNATDKSISWQSYDPKIATVDANGLVTAVATGETKIVAHTVNNAETATCIVTVKEQVKSSGLLGTQGTWEIKDGVLTIDYEGDMPQDVTLSTTDPEKAYRLVFEPYLKQIQKVVIKGHDVGVQPYLFYFDGDGPDGTHPDDNITEITISSGVKSIGKQAFVVYNLKHFYTYREMPPTLSSDNGGSNVFWQKRITANLTRLHELNKSGVGTNYARTNTEWVKFAVITNDLNQTDDPNYADVVGINDLTPALFQGDGAWYTLDGRRMQGKPAQKGLYIRNGKKVMVK